MKTKTLRRKLVLVRETIADLDIDKMKNAYGGKDLTFPNSNCLACTVTCQTCVYTCECTSPTT
ncbi:MAG: hypothetical protein QG657_5252 [Acidobacteriota bacterium]|nr:hypothetical protein [Acidobacteriota bacterium]